MKEDFNKTQQDMPPPRLSWYEQRRPAVGDDKSTTITISWAKVGPAIGLVVFIGGLVTTSVNAAVSVAQYKAQIEATERKVDEQQAQIRELQDQVTRLSTVQDMLQRLQGRMAALEETATPSPRDTMPASSFGLRNREPMRVPQHGMPASAAGLPPP